MNKKIQKVTVVILCLLVALLAASCGEENKGKRKSDTPEQEEVIPSGDMDQFVGTMSEYVYAKNPDIEFLKLEDIYFPEGLFDTGFGLYIWDNQNRKWVRTNTEEGKAAFRPDKSIMSFAHGMGGNGTADRPDFFYNEGYNVLTFLWGTFSRERDTNWYMIADKIWYRGVTRWVKDLSTSDESDSNFEFSDLPSATVAEMYGAFYYDLLAAFPNYSGKETMIFGHSYGGMLTGALTSFLCSQYVNGNIPAYMLPDKVNFLDPYFASVTDSKKLSVPWLTKEQQPVAGNDNEALYQAILTCRELGIAVGLDRTSKSVCWPTTLVVFGEELTASYWNLCNNIVYAHISDNSKYAFSDFSGEIHGYGWDWFDFYYTGYVLKDVAATVEEEAYCFAMPYEKMFAKAGTKYEFDVNGTLRNVDDDIIKSFFCDYDNDVNDAYENENELILAAYKKGKAKIAGFAYVDVNGNGKMDERIKDHFCGVTVRVTNSLGETIYEGRTTTGGYYEATTETAGEYTVAFVAPEGYTLSSESVKVTISDEERQVVINNVIVTKE